MNIHIHTILTAALTAVCAHAAVPLKWTVETSRVQPVTFEAYHGEALSLEATLQSYGKPVADTLQDVRLYWQTNGMGSAYWSAPASASGNVLRATWTPAMDTGANAVYGFIGVAGENYRASFQLRMRSSPGAVPNELELPRKHIDFSEVVVKNAPWASATIVHAVFAAADNARMTATNALAKANAAQSSADAAQRSADAATNSIEAAKTSAQEALAYASGVYNYMHADENAWFSGTNYVFGADAASRHKFAFEDGMDLGTVPCSMALIEKRDGVNQTVWDQRDWTSWYWSFKAEQMQSKINATNDEIRAEIETRAPAAWSQRTAATGLANPDSTTTWIDTKTITLSPGMAWETVANVDGCGYWTIVGNGVTIGGSGTNAVLEIKDFEGNRVITVKKGSSALVSVDKSQNIDGGWFDSDGRICFSFLSDIQPIGEYSTYLEDGGCFVDESDESCPVESEWEKIGDKIHRVHFKLKNGIIARSCFARFKAWKKGDTEIEFNGTQKISGGLIYNGVKIAPVIPAGAKVGDTITWKVVQ